MGKRSPLTITVRTASLEIDVKGKVLKKAPQAIEKKEEGRLKMAIVKTESPKKKGKTAMFG
jgi:hypothetical protein